LAAELGFEKCGIASAEPIGRADYLRRWLAAGNAGSMDYLRRRLDERLEPGKLLAGSRSIIVCAQVYKQPASPADASARGKVAMYARSRDYHKVMRRKLWRLVDELRRRVPERFEARVCVDTAPLLEREIAARAGVGWIGKNTLVLHQDLGSYFFLGAVLTTLDLAGDPPVLDHCGSCTACLDACPTAAFSAPYQMDASRCISYLTIEHRGDITKPFQELIGEWIFGCDVCQQVCPFNRQAPNATEPAFAQRRVPAAIDPREVLQWSPQAYDEVLSGTAVKRANLEMMRRNAQIVLSNGSRGAEGKS
jgi:epoxyqueuosine reductase